MLAPSSFASLTVENTTAFFYDNIGKNTYFTDLCLFYPVKILFSSFVAASAKYICSAIRRLFDM
jgi:hypothetical protein